MRAQPLLTLTVPVLTVLIGISHLWASRPMWHIAAEYRVAATGRDPVPEALHVDITLGELRDLLVSDPVTRQVIQRLAPDGVAIPDVAAGTIGSWRRGAIEFWSAVRVLPRRIAAAIGGAEATSPACEPALLVRASERSIDSRVVMLQIKAASPNLAEAAPAELLAAVRDVLRLQDRARTRARLEEIQPMREQATAARRAAADAVIQYQLGIGRHDPEASAAEIQSRLIDTRARRAELETDLKEAEANRLDIARQLETAAVEQTTRVVVEQNRRIQELKNEISTLEGRYAADLAVKTPKHEDMVRLRLEIESKRRDLNNEEILVIREKVQEPSLEYVGLLERQAQNNRQLVTLAGRELGLAETESRLSTELAQAVKTSQRMKELTTERQTADESMRRIDAEMAALESRLSSIMPFAHIALVGQSRVADARVPDEPNAVVHLTWTVCIAFGLMVLVPTLRSLATARLVAPWQIDALGQALPVELLGELPGSMKHALLRLSNGRGNI